MKNLRRSPLFFCMILTVSSAFFSSAFAQSDTNESSTTAAFTISSSAFENGQRIPDEYTCEGEDSSPALEWSNPPEGTVTYVLICDDPDAPGGTWVHWVLYNLRGTLRRLPEKFLREPELPGGAMNGRNSWERFGYYGPCPPPGSPHRYYFKLYALDRRLELQAGATKEEVLAEMEGSVLGVAEYMGTYSR